MAALDPFGLVTMESPLGLLSLASTPRGLSRVALYPSSPDQVTGRDRAPHGSLLAEATGQLGEYFAGHRREFDLPLDLQGTPFQRDVWQALAEIPFGQCTFYGAIAAALGRPGAVRAVGGAAHRNPLLFIIPCHRLIGKNGDLTGFAVGLERKRWLLSHEEALLSASSLGITEA